MTDDDDLPNLDPDADVDASRPDTIPEVDALAAAGLLTEQQARAYYLRDVLELPRRATADRMDVSVSVVDDHTRRARRKLEKARATVEVLENVE